MNNALESKFLHKLGQFIARPITSFNFKKVKNTDFSKENNSADIAAIAMPKGFPMEQIKGGTKSSSSTKSSQQDTLPKGILAIAPFKQLVKEELTIGNQSFLVKFALNKANCAFLSDKKQIDIALDCVKLLYKNGLDAKSFAFSPTGQFWVLLSNKPEKLAIAKANVAFKMVQKLLREELDVHQSLIELDMYKIQDCLPEID